MNLLILLVLVAVALIAIVFIGLGRVHIGDDEVGIVTKRFGAALPPGRRIAVNGEIGIQAQTLGAGRHFGYVPWLYDISRRPVVHIDQDLIGLVEATDGNALESGHEFGRPVACNNFQDARAFLDKGGQRGKQAAILTTGNYHINTELFKVETAVLTRIPPNEIGLVQARDGALLPPGRNFAGMVDCDNFQDAGAFFSKGGEHGNQLAILSPGAYRINTELFLVRKRPVVTIKPGEVGLVEAKDGADLPLGHSFGKVVQCQNFQNAQAFISGGGQRGKQSAILTTGPYQLNTELFAVTVKPAVTIQAGKIGIVEARDGADLPPGRNFAVVVPCDNFQDAEEFFKKGGQRGKQAAILTSGTYQINPDLFVVTEAPVVTIDSDQVGLVEARDGEPLPPGRHFAHVVQCNSFQNPEAFFQASGQRGRQLNLLNTGTYQINTELFRITPMPIVKVALNQIGLVKAEAGAPLRSGQHYGNVVDCNSFQDAEAFLRSGGQMGDQLSILRAGAYQIHPDLFSIQFGSVVVIPQGEIGVVVAQAGAPLPSGRRLANVVECDNFQDAQAFFDKGGQQGQQLAILAPGAYHINTRLFKVITCADAKDYAGLIAEDLRTRTIARDKVGIVTTLDGTPLPIGEIAGPVVEGHNKFQAPQKFIDAGGCRGLQEEVLGEGSWNLNPWFVKVEEAPIMRIAGGTVGVVISNVGKFSDVHHDLVDRGWRGIWKTPLDPGRYPINTRVMDVVVVPTYEITLEWSKKKKADSDYDANLHALQLRSKEAFSIELEVTQVIRIAPANAPKMISRVSEGSKTGDLKQDEGSEAKYGSIRKLVKRVLEPIVGNYFSHSAQENEALNFSGRVGELQESAARSIKEALLTYGVDAVGTFINHVSLPKELEDELTKKKIFEEQGKAYDAELVKERKRSELVKEQEKSKQQSALVQAESKKEIAAQEAESMVKTAAAAASAERLHDNVAIERKRQEAEIEREREASQTASLIKRIETLGPELYVESKKNEDWAEAVEKGNIGTPKVVIAGGGGFGGDSSGGIASAITSLAIAREFQNLLGPPEPKHTALASSPTGSAQTPLLEPYVQAPESSNARSPIVLLIESSQAMAGDRARRLAEAFNIFCRKIAEDRTTVDSTDLMIVTFDDSARLSYPFGSIVDLPPLPKSGGRAVSLGHGIVLALEQLEQQKRAYRAKKQSFRTPWLFALVAGDPTDDSRSAARQVKYLVDANELNFFAILVQGADLLTLKEYTNSSQSPLVLDGLKFDEMFVWLSDVTQRVAHSKVGGHVILPQVSWAVPPDYPIS